MATRVMDSYYLDIVSYAEEPGYVILGRAHLCLGVRFCLYVGLCCAVSRTMYPKGNPIHRTVS